jgi:hypothetical protein
MARAATSRKASPRKASSVSQRAAAAQGGGSIVWLSGLACGVIAAVAPGIAILAAVLLAPGLAALKFDHEPGRPVARTVLTCGLAGCVQPVITLWSTGQSFDTALAIATDARTAGVAWSAAAAGWLLTQIAPLIIRAILEATSLARSARLRTARTRLAEVWGIDQPGVER